MNNDKKLDIKFVANPIETFESHPELLEQSQMLKRNIKMIESTEAVPPFPIYENTGSTIKEMVDLWRNQLEESLKEEGIARIKYHGECYPSKEKDCYLSLNFIEGMNIHFEDGHTEECVWTKNLCELTKEKIQKYIGDTEYNEDEENVLIATTDKDGKLHIRLFKNMMLTGMR